MSVGSKGQNGVGDVVIAWVAVACLAAGAPATAQPVASSAFGDAMDGSLEAYVAMRLQRFGRDEGNEEMLAAFREQLERGLISEDQYAEAVTALGGGPLLRGGRPFTGTVVGDGAEPVRLEADFEDGRLVRVLYRGAGGDAAREIVMGDGRITETIFWGGPYGDAPRLVSVHENHYMGDVTTRVTTPDGELVMETTADGEIRDGPGWLGGVNMWDADNAFYRRIEACEPVKLYVDGSYFEVVGPRGGGCGVRYGHWKSPDPADPRLAGESMVCIHRSGSAYDFIEVLHGQGMPTEDCVGGLADLLRGGSGG